MTSGPGSARPQIGPPECLNERAHPLHIVGPGEMTEPTHRAPEPFVREARILKRVFLTGMGVGLVVVALGFVIGLVWHP